MNNFTFESFKEAYLALYLPHFISEYLDGETPDEGESEEINDEGWSELLQGDGDDNILKQLNVETVAGNVRGFDDSDRYTVFKFDGKFYRYDYTYYSYSGASLYTEEFTEVKPRQVVSTVYD